MLLYSLVCEVMGRIWTRCERNLLIDDSSRTIFSWFEFYGAVQLFLSRSVKVDSKMIVFYTRGVWCYFVCVVFLFFLKKNSFSFFLYIVSFEIFCSWYNILTHIYTINWYLVSVCLPIVRSYCNYNNHVLVLAAAWQFSVVMFTVLNDQEMGTQKKKNGRKF